MGHNPAYPNLRPPWKKGESGNPGGRPKTRRLTDYMRDALQETVQGEDMTKEEAIARAVLNLLIDKIARKKRFDPALFNAIFERCDPRPRTVEVHHKDDDTPTVIAMPIAGPPDDTVGLGEKEDADEGEGEGEDDG